MHLAYEYGADRIWIVNVGDLKPMEFPIEFFLELCVESEALADKRQLAQFTQLWAEREFGPEHAAEIADLVTKYTKYNARRKPELLDAETFSLIDYHEARDGSGGMAEDHSKQRRSTRNFRRISAMRFLSWCCIP